MAGLPFAVVPLGLGTITTGNETTSGPAANLNLNFLGMVWKSNGNANLFVRGDMGVAQTVDFVAMLSANAAVGTKIRIRFGMTQAEVDGTAPYDSGAIDFISPSIVRKDSRYHSHHEIASAVTARWWRIDISGHTGDFSAFRLIMGKKLTPARFYDRDFERGVDDYGSLEISRLGVLHVTPGVKLRRLKFKLSWVTEAEVEEMFMPMIEEIGGTGLTYWCFDPEPTIYRQRRTYFGWFSQVPFATGGAKPKTFQKDFDIISLI